VKNVFILLRLIILMIVFMAIAILLSQVILYDYASNDKTVSKATEYERETKIETALAKNTEETDGTTSIDFASEEEEETVTTGKYEVTSTDLSNYEKTNEYNPGKVNPFSTYKVEDAKDTSDDSGSTTDTNGTATTTEEKDNNNSSGTTQNSTTTTKGLTK
jgi:hypothetical protein